MQDAPRSLPSAEELISEALRSFKSHPNINELHSRTYELMIAYKSKYYERKVDEFLSKLDIGEEDKIKVRKEMLKTVKVIEKGREYEYANMMEEASRRISQSFQPISGNLAELCVQRELELIGLRKNFHFKRRVARSDITLFHPNFDSTSKKLHRIEVKNVSLRERATRGLKFDGDSMIGFFNQPWEFTKQNVRLIDLDCEERNGYCYVPPSTLSRMIYKGKRFRPNTRFAEDMRKFVESGAIP